MKLYPAIDDDLVRDLKKAGYRRIALQVPAGLLPGAGELARRLEELTGAHVIVPTRACFGACDPPSREESLAAEAVVTLGHAPIPNMPQAMTEYYVEMRAGTADIEKLVRTVVDGGLPHRLGLVASIQHIELLEPFRQRLAEHGISAEIGTGGRRLGHPGQALGCNYTAATTLAKGVDGFLLLATGRFHPVGLALSVEQPVWSLDPMQATLEGPYDRDSMVAKRLLLIESAMDAKQWGVLVSAFPGQCRSPLAQRLVGKARAHGREAGILTFDRLDPRDLIGRRLDAYVVTACPRIAIDDAALYDRPMLTAPEFLSAIGDRPLLPYRFDTFV